MNYSEKFEKMRIAGKLAAQSKDYSAKFPKIVIENN